MTTGIKRYCPRCATTVPKEYMRGRCLCGETVCIACSWMLVQCICSRWDVAYVVPDLGLTTNSSHTARRLGGHSGGRMPHIEDLHDWLLPSWYDVVMSERTRTLRIAGRFVEV